MAAALVARLQQHSANPDVQAECCWSLCPNALLGDASALAFLPAIVAALRAHPGHAGLQARGSVALGLICEKRSEDALLSAPGADDGVRMVVEALRAHPADDMVQFACCRALDAMSESLELRETAVAAGAVPAVVAALHAHALRAEVNMVCEAVS
jgi:hypothetical protein